MLPFMTSELKTKPPRATAMLIEHIGADLWRAFRAYEKAMFERVAAEGFSDIAQADSDVLVFVGPEGASLTDIARQRRVSKQAVHEQVHGLVDRNYLTLETDPADRRVRRVRYTAKGEALVAALRRVKRQLHKEMTLALGFEAMADLRAHLAKLEQSLK
jgi:DNA-binding MarR family transcriptional regulator